jgi:hypothetical protein
VTLAHLAVCPDCRTIVTLSLPPEESPKPQPESVRKPWLSGWNLAWPAAAALAALVFLIDHVHNAATTGSITAAPTQMAASHPPAPLEAAQAPHPISPPRSRPGSRECLKSAERQCRTQHPKYRRAPPPESQRHSPAPEPTSHCRGSFAAECPQRRRRG